MKGGVKQMGIMISKYVCNKCGHTWYPRSIEIPKMCPNPKCRTVRWDKPIKQENENK